MNGTKLILFLALIAGCTKTIPQPPVEPPVATVTPPAPVTPPTPQVSASYLRGYWDGYNGRWLAPGRWVVDDDYRNGRVEGKRDRLDSKEPRYPKNIKA